MDATNPVPVSSLTDATGESISASKTELKTSSEYTSNVTLRSLGAFDSQGGLSLTRKQMLHLILEYLIVEGYKDVAEKFRIEAGISESPSEMRLVGDSLDDRTKIREAVLRRNIEDVVDTVNRLWPELFDRNPFIYFQLRQLQMVELIRNRHLEEALIFAQTYLADPVVKRLSEHPQLLTEMQNTMALLAFENPSDSIYGRLLGPQHVELVAGSLNRAILRHIETVGSDDVGMSPSQSTGDVADETSSGVLAASASTSSPYSAGVTSSSTTVPRLTKMIAILLHFSDYAQIDLPPELASI